MSELETLGPIDRTPGIPGSDKLHIFKMLTYLHIYKMFTHFQDDASTGSDLWIQSPLSTLCGTDLQPEPHSISLGFHSSWAGLRLPLGHLRKVWTSEVNKIIWLRLALALSAVAPGEGDNRLHSGETSCHRGQEQCIQRSFITLVQAQAVSVGQLNAECSDKLSYQDIVQRLYLWSWTFLQICLIKQFK